MKSLFLVSLLVGCGYSSYDNTAIGQVKKIHHNTPIFCSNYDDADISLGVMRDGVGSMSKEDIDVVIPANLIDDFEKLAASGGLVEIHYNQARMAFCPDTDLIASEIKQLE